MLEYHSDNPFYSVPPSEFFLGEGKTKDLDVVPALVSCNPAAIAYGILSEFTDDIGYNLEGALDNTYRHLTRYIRDRQLPYLQRKGANFGVYFVVVGRDRWYVQRSYHDKLRATTFKVRDYDTAIGVYVNDSLLCLTSDDSEVLSIDDYSAQVECVLSNWSDDHIRMYTTGIEDYDKTGEFSPRGVWGDEVCERLPEILDCLDDIRSDDEFTSLSALAWANHLNHCNGNMLEDHGNRYHDTSLTWNIVNAISEYGIGDVLGLDL
jgi:hypothetical protein